MSDDFLCIGYEGMSDAIRDHKGERVFSAEQIRQRFRKELKEEGVLLKMKLGKGQVKKCCAWYSRLQDFFEKKYQI